MSVNSGYKNLKVYQTAYELALHIHEITKKFPAEEKYSLTDQVRRSSRSVCTNIAEAYRKRIYPKHFVTKVSDADAECSETMTWLDFSKDFNYIDSKTHISLTEQYESVGRMLGSMAENPERFSPKQKAQLPTASATAT